MGAHPLTEDDGFGLWPLEDFGEQRHEFINLATMIGLVIEQVGTVAGHSHVHQTAGQAALVGIGQIPGLAPAAHDAIDDLTVLVVVGLLLVGHRHEHRVVHTRRQLLEHFGLAPTQQYGRQGTADLLEIPITDYPSRLIQGLVLMPQSPCRPETMTVHVLHDRE